MQERLASAESNRQFSLEERRLKASAVTVRVNEAVERVTGRLNAVATRTDVALQAAEERRLASCSERTERLSARGNQLNKQREYIARTMELRNRELGEQLHARLEQVLTRLQYATVRCMGTFSGNNGQSDMALAWGSVRVSPRICN